MLPLHIVLPAPKSNWCVGSRISAVGVQGFAAAASSIHVRLSEIVLLRQKLVLPYEVKVVLAPASLWAVVDAVFSTDQPVVHSLDEHRILDVQSCIHLSRLLNEKRRKRSRPGFERKSRNASLKAKNLAPAALGFPL
jgi:hypothetical protein